MGNLQELRGLWRVSDCEELVGYCAYRVVCEPPDLAQPPPTNSSQSDNQ